MHENVNGIGVVVWHVGRCGSSVLGNCLGQNPVIKYENEIFNRWMPQNRGNQSVPRLEQQLKDIMARRTLPCQLIEIKFLKAQHPGIFDMTFNELIPWLERHGFSHHIILERKNVLRRMVSHCVASQTRCFHIPRSNKKPSLQPIHLDPKAIRVGIDTAPLLDWLRIIQDSYSHLHKILLERGDVLALSYEQHIILDPTEAYRLTCKHLGIEVTPVIPRFQRTNPFPLRLILRNYSEISDLITPTPFAWMLEEE